MEAAHVFREQDFRNKTLDVIDTKGLLCFGDTITTIMCIPGGIRLETTHGDALEITNNGDQSEKYELQLRPRFGHSTAVKLVQLEGHTLKIDSYEIYRGS